MAVDGCGLVCQCIIILFNFIFAVVGTCLLGLGLWLRFSNNTRPIFEISDNERLIFDITRPIFEKLNSSIFVIGVKVLIVLGIVMLIVVTFGDHGACSRKRCSLQVFACLVAILTGADIIIGVLAYIKLGEVGLCVAEFYTSLYAVFLITGDPVIAVILMFVHKMIHCCGVTGVTLIEPGKKICPAPKRIMENFQMASCPIELVTALANPLVMLGISFGTGALLITALICSSVLAKRMHMVAASPQYIILSPPPPLTPSIPSSPPPTLSPVRFFTPLSAAHLPIAQA